MVQNSTAYTDPFFMGVICGAAWIILSAQRYYAIIQLPGEMLLLPFQFLIASVLLGVVHSGMWFGHWYLVTPDLPVMYLKRFNTVLLYTLSGMALLLCLNIFFRQQSTDVVAFNLFYQIIFGMRVLIGIAGTLLLYFITWDCLRPKSVARDVLGATRAATGFLLLLLSQSSWVSFAADFYFWKCGSSSKVASAVKNISFVRNRADCRGNSVSCGME